MDKMKTLKDLRTTEIRLDGGCFDEAEYDIVKADELRQEAIKWIKEHETEDPTGECCSKKHRCEACERFMKFFNITEEDLMNNKIEAIAKALRILKEANITIEKVKFDNQTIRDIREETCCVATNYIPYMDHKTTLFKLFGIEVLK